MKTQPAILTIDVGTSALKATLYTSDGRATATAKQSLTYHSPQPGWAECRPEDWWTALVAALKSLTGSGYDLTAARCLGITGQMHTPILLDANDAPLSPTILWLDRRAAAETAELMKMLDLAHYEINSSFTLPKLLWLHRNQPDVLGQTRKLLWPKDYLRFRLTGRAMTDVTEAAGAALLNWQDETWAVERLALVGMSETVLPELAAPTADAGPLLPGLAKELGLSPDIRVIVGAGDVMALVSAAPPQPKRITFSVGSSGMVSSPLSSIQNLHDPDNRVYIYPFLGYRLLNAVLSTSGASLQWARQALYDDEPNRASALDAALSTPPGADGLLFLPYLMGERSPYWQDDLRAGFHGLSLHHRRPHMMRAVLEGVAFSLRHILAIVAELGVPIDEIALAGGGAAVAGWPQIFADVCQLPVVIYGGEETVTRPLYAHCATALEASLSFDDALARTFDDAPQRLSPRAQLAPTYDNQFHRYRTLADFSASIYTDKSQIQ